MKRKPIPVSEPTEVIDPALMQKAKLALETDKLKRMEKCSVCSSPCAPNSSEKLCWVCRRLKISAWRDSEQQPSAQE